MSRSVAICICTRDRPDELGIALEAIARSTYPVSAVVVSDDGTGRRTQEVCANAACAVTYTTGPRRGLSPNRNHALTLVVEDLVLFLDDDCLLGPDFLATAVAHMETNEATWGRERVVVSGAEANNGRLVTARAQDFLGFQSRPYSKGAPMSSIVINATLFPRAALDRHRFDAQIRYGYEEVDLASRLAQDGYRIVESADAVNIHQPSSLGRQDYDGVVTASRLYVTVKRYARTERRYGRAAAFAVVGPLHAMAAGARRDGVDGLRAAMRATRLAVTYVVRHASEAEACPADRISRLVAILRVLR